MAKEQTVETYIPKLQTLAPSPDAPGLVESLQAFLKGEGSLTGKQIGGICGVLTENPDLKQGMADLFNTDFLKRQYKQEPDGPKDIAPIIVMERPEHSAVKERFVQWGKAIRTAVDGLTNDPNVADAMKPEDLDTTGENYVIRASPDLAQAMVCSKSFIDPLVKFVNLPPIDTKPFSRDVDAEVKRLQDMRHDDLVNKAENLEEVRKATQPVINRMVDSLKR